MGLMEMRKRLLGIINLEEDSLRLYQIGDKHSAKVEHHGIKVVPDLNQPFIV